MLNKPNLGRIKRNCLQLPYALVKWHFSVLYGHEVIIRGLLSQEEKLESVWKGEKEATGWCILWT